MGKKRVFSLLLCAALTVALLPTAALAASTGSFVVEGDAAGYSYANHTLTFGAAAAGKTYTVSMAPGVKTLMADKIDIGGGTSEEPVSLTLDNINISLSSEGCACALESNSYVDLTLRGDNFLSSKSGDDHYSGLQVSEGATLSISEDSATPATDSMTVSTSSSKVVYEGTEIGGDNANIIINSGAVTAIGGYCHEGIRGSNVTINGGTIIASSGGYGIVSTAAMTINGGDVTAIGPGGGISGNTVAITGGIVTASGYSSPSICSSTAVYISGGSVHGTGNPVISGTPQNNSSDQTPVYLTTVTLPGISEKTPVSSLKVSVGGALYSYGIEGMETGADGKLYLYLPAGACNFQIKAGAYSYAAALTVGSTGVNTVTANDLNSTSVDIDTPGTYVLTGSTNVNQVVVSGGTETEPVNIVLDNINISISDHDDANYTARSPIDLHSGSFVNLTLQGTNMLYVEADSAIHVPEGAAVTIGGGGSLTVITVSGGTAIGSHGSYDLPENSGSITINGGIVTAIVSYNAGSPAIGSDCKGHCGSITINGGTVTANASPRAAAIGSGFEGSVGSITINGGTVTATAGDLGAAIGGGSDSAGGSITINGGTVTAAGDFGAGIGGGADSAGGSITITGGTVTASSYLGAGIGGGSRGVGGSVYISGGNVHASSACGEAIGKGHKGSGSGTLQNNSTDQTPVCLTAVTLQDTAGTAVGDMPVSSLALSLNGSAAYSYGAKDMQTDADGKLHLYLPAGAVVTAAQAAEGHYLGSVTASSDSAASQGVLTLSSVSGVTPEGTGAPVSGNLAITFLGEMDTSVTGTVSISGGAALTGGAWSDGNTVYTVPYSGLSYNTSYTVSVSGFKNAAGNTIAADNTYSFTTGKEPASSNGGDDTAHYTIRSSAGTGGSISPSGNTTVKEGNDQIYTITANDGYEIKDVLVDGTSVGAVTTYTFSDVSGNHTIAATFQEKNAEWQNPYTDILKDGWCYSAVRFVSENGLMNGTASDTFSPNSGMTRGMFVTVLYRLSGDTGSYTSSFADVPSGKWYENSVAWATQNDISGGVGNNRFAPDSGITRQQLAVLLYHYAKYKGYDVSIGEDTNILSYKDALDISDYAYPALQWACGAGIMNGDSGYLSPNGPVTRAQVAAMLERFVENVIG